MRSLVPQAWQSWKSAKAVAFLVVLALTVGIGSATAIYTVVNTLLLKPVPYQNGERFVSVLGASLDDPSVRAGLSVTDAMEYQRARSFDVFGWMRFANFNLTAPGQPQYLNAVQVTPALANGVGVKPEIGQWFHDLAGGPEAVLSHGLWQPLGGDPGIVGKAITLNGRVYTVTGVMPPGFQLPLAGFYSEAAIDIWLPLDPTGKGQGGGGYNFCYGRLRPGATMAGAVAEVKSIAADLAKRDPAFRRSYTARVDSLRELITRDIKPIILLLFGASGLLLLITCANIGGLLVARSVARARDTAVRVALGARLRQLATQYFLEGMFVSLPGALGGLVFGAALVRVMVVLVGQTTALSGEIAMDWRVLVFALGTALGSAALTSMAPVWQAARTLPNEVLSEGVRASAGARSRRLSQSLVVAEVALAFVLLVLSAVLVSELYRVARVSPGFDPAHLLTFQVSIASEEFPGTPSQVAYETRLVQAVEAIPGVASAGLVNQLPLKGCCYTTAIFPDAYAAKPGDTIAFLVASPDYLRTMQIPLRRGRFLNERDTGEKPIAVVINQAAAMHYWPNQDPVGAFGHFNQREGDPFQVAGVVGDVRNNGLDNPTVPEVYLPFTVAQMNPLHFVVRSSLPPSTLITEVRHAIQNVNPGQPIHEVKAMSEIVGDSLALKRLASYVMTFFALAAVLMACIGAYGVVSYSVRQRTVEIGTRMALGAVSRDVLYLVVGSGLKIAAYGIAIGGVASIAATWLLVRNFEIAIGNGGEGRIENPGFLPFVFSAAMVAAVAVASSFFPAWWATLLSPMVAIRNQPEAIWQSARNRIRSLFEGFWRVAAGDYDVTMPGDATLVTELIHASRRAASFREALDSAMESLRGTTGAQSVFLLENVADGEYRMTAAVPGQDLAGRSIPQHGLLLNRLRSYAAPLPISSADLDTWRRWAGEYKPEHVAEVETLRDTGARLAVPLRTRDEVLGVLVLGPPDAGEEYGPTEKRLLRGCADQFALILENARLTDRLIEQEKLRRDVALAAEVQQRLLASHSLETAAASLAAVNFPARSVGGDYYDFLDLGDHRTGIALADVAGKGVAAALIMAVVQASLRVIASEPDISLPQLAAKMNHFLHRSTGSNSYATFFYAQLDERSRELRYVNAGHNPPYLLRVDGASTAVEELSTGGTIIGMFPQVRYEEGKILLRPGDLLAIFTDGVTEAQDPSEAEFGEERLQQLLVQLVHLPVEEMSSQISQELKNWIQDAPQYDDITFVLMKVK
ncbi:MAG: ADOP family duplicated permease [Acidobacteriia bacterium]|nr:ADOP family duplicated permease [Terriglobia bacterium]